MIEFVEVSNQILLLEWEFWLRVLAVLLLQLSIQFLPLLVIGLSILLILLNSIHLLLSGAHAKSFFEGEWINFLEDRLQCNQTLLEDLVPVLVCELCNNGHQHWESLFLVGLEDIKEVVILKETHGSVSHLQMNPSNALDDSLEESGY